VIFGIQANVAEGENRPVHPFARLRGIIVETVAQPDGGIVQFCDGGQRSGARIRGSGLGERTQHFARIVSHDFLTFTGGPAGTRKA
jgi:hypothetical protein